MELATITMPRVEARKSYLEYREAIREMQGKELDEIRARQLDQDRAIARGYKQLSVGNQLIQMNRTIVAGGFDDKGLPKLALMRADIEAVEVTRWASGDMVFQPRETNWRRRHRAASKVLRFDGPPVEQSGGYFRVDAIADAPIIPPQYRPTAHLKNYHLLWEAEWRRARTARRAPRDPALLKHLGGDLWAVLAIWDLTDVERAALEGGRV